MDALCQVRGLGKSQMLGAKSDAWWKVGCLVLSWRVGDELDN